jgi:hypothetical protein
MGGSDDPSNLIKLTVEEHADAHLELYYKHNKIEDWYAYLALSGQISSDEARRKVCSERMKKNNPTKNPEIVKKILQSRSGYRPSEETKRKTSLSLLGKKKSNTSNMNKDKIKTYLVTTPDGKEIIVKHMRNFCQDHDLTESLMYKVASGNRNHHKKYKCIIIS